MKPLAIAFAAIGIALLIFTTCGVVVQQDEQVVVTQFGEYVTSHTAPGFYFKTPFIQDIHRYPKRALRYDSSKKDVITGDKKTATIDNYARWRIVDPLKFLQSIGTTHEAHNRLDDIIYSELRVEIGRFSLSEIVTTARETIIANVTQRTNDVTVKNFGIEILDVRIKRADLPAENQTAVFERMKSERARQATQYRSEGEEQAAMIRADADKERTIILAEAYRQGQILRGEGDAESAKIYNEALNQDPEFYAFVRTLEAYRKTITPTTRLILTPDSDLLKYLRNAQ